MQYHTTDSTDFSSMLKKRDEAKARMVAVQVSQQNKLAAASRFTDAADAEECFTTTPQGVNARSAEGKAFPPKESFCHCKRCGLLLYTNSLSGGRCAMCRADIFINATVAAVILCIIMLLLAACTSGEADTSSQSTEWKRCVKNGDWLETPYCDAISKGDSNV